MTISFYLNEGRIVPDVAKVRRVLDRLRKEVVWKKPPTRSILTRKYIFPHSPKSLISLLNASFAKMSIKFVYDKHAPSETHGEHVIEGINAYLDPSTLKITVEIGPWHLYNLMDPEEFDNVVNAFVSMIGHEFIHLEQLNRQLIKIGIKATSSEDIVAYLSNPMEIQSYAWQIVNDLQDLRLSKKEALTTIKNQNKLAQTSTIFNLYLEMFKDTFVLKNLLKRIYQYVEEVYI